MNVTHAPRAILRLETKRSDLAAFEIIGKITEEDMAWMAEQVDGAFELHDRIDLMLIMTNFDGAEAAAVLNGEAASVSLKSLRHLRKYGVVGAPGWARAMIETMKWLTPVEEKTFELHEAAAAWQWIDEGREEMRA